jgi:hypothetical protein
MERAELDGLVRRAADIPGSTLPVDMARLGGGDPPPGGSALSAIVWFPPGWERPSKGAYTVDETVVVWEGDLTVSGVTVRTGELLWVPPTAARTASSSSGGAVCFARFSGPPRWREGAGDDLPCRAPAPGNEQPSPLDVAGRLLDTGAGPQVWLLDGLPATLAPRHLEVFAPDDGTWLRAEPGEALPALRGRCWVLLPRRGAARAADRTPSRG